MRQSGVRELLVYCSDYLRSHKFRSVLWNLRDEVRLSDLEPGWFANNAAGVTSGTPPGTEARKINRPQLGRREMSPSFEGVPWGWHSQMMTELIRLLHHSFCAVSPMVAEVRTL